MSEHPRDWLPPGATSGELARARLKPVIDAWSVHWFVSRTFQSNRLAERSALSDGEGWLSAGGSAAVRRAPASALRLAEASLNLRQGVELTDRDRRMLDRLAQTMSEDLCRRLDAEFGDGPAPGGWVEAAIAEGAGPDLLWLALPAAALAAACRKAMGPPPRQPALSSMKAMLTEIPIRLEATVGHVQLSMPDLAALEPGDVLVLSTRVEDGIEVSPLGSSQVFARARLADQDGELALAFQAVS